MEKGSIIFDQTYEPLAVGGMKYVAEEDATLKAKTAFGRGFVFGVVLTGFLAGIMIIATTV